MTETNGTGTAEKILIKRLKVSGLLSFGPKGIDLPMRGLNVLIGANGSGKSNFLEVLALLRAAPKDLFGPMRAMGGVQEWMWKGPGAGEAEISVAVTAPPAKELRHNLVMRQDGPRLELADESILEEGVGERSDFAHIRYNYQRGVNPTLYDRKQRLRDFKRNQLSQNESVLSQIRDPELYPALTRLQDAYESMSMFRNWSFGPDAQLRRDQSTHDQAGFLQDGGANLALVLSNIHQRITKDLRESLRLAYEGLEYVSFHISGGTIGLFLEEIGGRLIPATRVSDGTLHYLCLLAILLHPEPPPLIILEEPELGLHPDLIQHIGDLLKKAATRTQLVVTTHSIMLVDALGDRPESVVICETNEGESSFERLDGHRMKQFLKHDSLGGLWNRGMLGGNRW